MNTEGLRETADNIKYQAESWLFLFRLFLVIIFAFRFLFYLFIFAFFLHCLCSAESRGKELSDGRPPQVHQQAHFGPWLPPFPKPAQGRSCQPLPKPSPKIQPAS